VLIINDFYKLILQHSANININTQQEYVTINSRLDRNNNAWCERLFCT